MKTERGYARKMLDPIVRLHAWYSQNMKEHPRDKGMHVRTLDGRVFDWEEVKDLWRAEELKEDNR